MKKVNFGKIAVKDIEGRDVTADVRQQLGNQLYMQGHNIEECELGKKIYFAQDADGQATEVELDDKEMAIVRQAVQGYGYVLREAILAACGLNKK